VPFGVLYGNRTNGKILATKTLKVPGSWYLEVYLESFYSKGYYLTIKIWMVDHARFNHFHAQFLASEQLVPYRRGVDAIDDGVGIP